MTQLFDDAGTEEEVGTVWVFAEPGSQDLGEVVLEDDLDEDFLGDEKGVVLIEGMERFVQKVAVNGRDSFRQAAK